MIIKSIKGGSSRADAYTNMTKNFDKFFDSPIVQFTNTAPMLVNYYTVDTIKSTTGIGFNDNSGPYSGAIKYKKIIDFHIYGYDAEVTADKEKNEAIDDIGKVENTIALVLPNTLVPKEDDRLTFAIHDHKIIYKVISVNLGTYNNRPYYKIEYGIDTELPNTNFTVGDLERNLVTETYVFRYELVGTDLSCFVEKEDNKEYSRLLELKKDLMEMYEDLFYDEYTNSLLYEKEPGYFVYLAPLVDLQNEFKPILLYKGKVEAILHHENISLGKNKVNWIRSKLRKMIKRKGVDAEDIISNGLIFYNYMYMINRENTLYNLVSFFNNPGKSYFIVDYNKYHERATSTTIHVPEDMKEVVRLYLNKEEISFKKLNEVLDDYDIDMDLDNLLFIPIFFIIINTVIREKLNREKLDLFI